MRGQLRSPSDPPRKPKVIAKACLPCRARKVRCDLGRPQCSTCSTHERECVYRIQPPRKRPTFTRIHELQCETSALKAFIVTLRDSSPEVRQSLLSAAVDANGEISLPNTPSREVDHVDAPEGSEQPTDDRQPLPSGNNVENGNVSSEDELDMGHFISLDETGQAGTFGPSSSLHYPTPSERSQLTSQNARVANEARENLRNTLIANAALQRQLEYRIKSKFAAIHGVRSELAVQLLDLHWMRQHHTFLLTYRPAIMRDLQNGGPHATPFLLNSIFACSSKYSDLLEVRDDPADSSTAGQRFFRRCDELLAEESLLIRPSIPTVVGLLLLGSTFNSRGETSKGWLYTGYALRMVYDLGLHLDPQKTTNNPEEMEIRRRVFWGAFVCDKLQSLYLGRPMAINLRDSRVSTTFYDTYEENDFFQQVSYPPAPHATDGSLGNEMVLHSVSVFQQLCLLSKIITTIINRFYAVGTTFSNAKGGLQQVDQALQKWKENLASELDFQPWASVPSTYPAPNVMLLHGLYHALIILLHRPFISDGHLRSAAPPIRSWERCTAAARCITSISTAYKNCFSLAHGPYLLGYTVYVACTIHVRNAASQGPNSQEHASMLVAGLNCLDELCLPNPGVVKPARIIRKLAEANKIDTSLKDLLHLNQSTPEAGQDMDAILNMFRTTNGYDARTDDETGRRGRVELGLDVPFDPLFGLMDMSFMSFPAELVPP